MRVRTKIWIAIAAACVALTVYEIPNAAWIARFAFGGRDRYAAGGDLDVPAVVTDELVAADPEAGDMFGYSLRYASKGTALEDLAALVEKHPKNEFFLAQLAEALRRDGIVDPRLVQALADRLLVLSGDNAHYRYMKGWLILATPGNSHSRSEALRQFQLGHESPEFYLPYSTYKDRLDRLYAETGLIWMRPNFRSFCSDLAKQAQRSSVSANGKVDDTFGELAASIAGIADRIIKNAYDDNSLVIGAVLLGRTEGARLRDSNLAETERQQARLSWARAQALLSVCGRAMPFGSNLIDDFVILVFAPILLIATVCATMGEVIEFVARAARRRKPRVHLNIRILGLIDVGLVAVLLLLLVLTFARKWSIGHPPAPWVFGTSWFFLLYSTFVLVSVRPANLALLGRPRLWVAALCASLWFKGVVFWLVGDLGIFVIKSETGLALHVGIVLGWSVLCILIWDAISHPSDMHGIVKGRHAVLSAEWVAALMILHIFGSRWVQMNDRFANPLARFRPLPEATQEVYQQVVLGKASVVRQSAKDKRAAVPRSLAYAAPEDVEAFFAACREAGLRISDEPLWKLLRDCGRDLRPIILGSLADPNACEVLVIRAGWGDMGAKEYLARIYDQRLAVYTEAGADAPLRGRSSLGELIELSGALARISNSVEGRQRLSRLLEDVVMNTRSLGIGPALTEPRHAERIMKPFFEALDKLPKAEASQLVKSYLRQTRFVDFFGDRGRDIEYLATLLANGDRDLAEEVVAALAGLPVAEIEPPNMATGESQDQREARLKRYRDRNSPACLDAVFTHLGVESIPLLLGYVGSENEQLGAFVVWRVTSLGYEWTDEQLAALRRDSYWKVRMNAIFAHDRDDLAAFVEDENPLVRTVARTLIESGRQ